MFNDEQKKKILGEFYIDVKTERNKTVYFNIINKFINSDNSFMPYLDKLRKRQYYNSNTLKWIDNKPNLKLLDIYMLSLEIDPHLKDGFCYATNDCFVCYDTELEKKVIYVRRGGYGQIKEMQTTLGFSTLQRLYNMFVYDVLSYKILNRRKKQIYHNFHNLFNKDVLYSDIKNNRYLKYNMIRDINGALDPRYKYNLFDTKMYLLETKYDSNLKPYSNTVASHTFKQMETFFNNLGNMTVIRNKEELEAEMKHNIDIKIEKLIAEKEGCLSIIKSKNIF